MGPTHELSKATCVARGRVLSFDVVVQKDDTVDSIAQKLALPREVLLSANRGQAAAGVAVLRCHVTWLSMQLRI